MPSPRSSIRGAQDIRTQSGAVNPMANPSTAYLRIAVLEMEKERRGREKESALRRVRNVDSRSAQIEAEKAALLASIGPSQGNRRPGGPSDPAAPPPAAPGVRIRY